MLKCLCSKLTSHMGSVLRVVGRRSVQALVLVLDSSAVRRRCGFRTETRALMPGHHRPVALYTPEDNVMRPSAALQRELEWFGLGHGPPAAGPILPPQRNLTEKDLYFRRFPVEGQYFTQHPHFPCARQVVRVPASDYRCEHEESDPKFSCGRVSQLQRPGCQVWSIGSAGETCFEEYVHQQAPACQIHTFDPTLPAAQQAHVQSLQRRGVLQFHPVGLGSKEEMLTMRKYSDKSSHKRCEEGGLSARQRKVLGCLHVKARPLYALMTELGTQWIDYLKVDCEGCELDAVPRFLKDSMEALGHVPVTQLQIEVHVLHRSVLHSESQMLARSYATHGLLKGRRFPDGWNNPQVCVPPLPVDAHAP